MRIAATLLLLLTAAIPAMVRADAEMAFDRAPVSDDELAGSYGKFIAPGGIDLAMSVQSDTAVDGHLVLRSVFSVDQGPGSVRIYAPAAGSLGPAVQTADNQGRAQSAAPTQGVAVVIDRTGATTSVQPVSGGAQGAPTVNVGSDSMSPQSVSSGNDGLAPVAASAAGVQTGGGVVSLTTTANGARVTLDSLGLSVSHLVGQATGTVIANTGNNRAIDTVTSVSIDVRNGDMLTIGSSLMRVGNLGMAAAQGLIR